MSRCDHHRLSEPCYYCERGIQPFVTATDYQDALEERLRVMTRKIQVAALDQMVAEPDGIDLKEAVAVIRDYALGDLVMLSPSLKRLKEKDPKRPLVLVTDPGLIDILTRNGIALSEHSEDAGKRRGQGAAVAEGTRKKGKV